MFAVFGTIISTIVFGIITWILALMGAISKKAIGEKPFVNSMLYGESTLRRSLSIQTIVKSI